MKRILIFLLLLLSFSAVESQTYENLRVSLLTVMPRSKAVYTLYGHTAIRVNDPIQKIDVVFNWGTFDSGKPNFLFRFVKGETDYFLSTPPYDYFIYEYSQDDETTVIEQVLNIPDSEKENLVKMLENNLLPQNIEYRYNFFFDNCTTRPRDIIERFCGGKLEYPQLNEAITFRKLIRNYTQSHPWLELGVDCVIGNGADSLISYRSGLFLPDWLMDALDQSFVVSPDGQRHPIVISTATVVQTKNNESGKGFHLQISPCVAGALFFLFYFALALCGFVKKRRFNLFFAFLFLLAGIGGCIVAMLCFFSVHPCTWPNWNILWLHPLHFVAFVGYWFKKSYPLFRWYHAINFVLLSGFLAGWHWIPQELNPAFVPLVLSLWIVSGYELIGFINKNFRFRIGNKN